jgi:hypothetical protein
MGAQSWPEAETRPENSRNKGSTRAENDKSQGKEGAKTKGRNFWPDYLYIGHSAPSVIATTSVLRNNLWMITQALSHSLRNPRPS